MNLYLLTLNECEGASYDSAVVAANTESEALLIHPDGDKISDWSKNYLWTRNPKNIDIKFIGIAAEGIGEGVVVSSYQAGLNKVTNMDSIIINGLELRCTCGACPEQYDVYNGGDQVAYFRLRHGCFRVDVPYCGGETIYQANPKGDGIFHRDERQFYLEEAVSAVLRYRGTREINR